MTLRESIENAKCRKGKAVDITSQGAYWLAHDVDGIKIKRAGGDGIGQSGPGITIYLELRHYRNGKIKAKILRDAWHQNGSYGGAGQNWYNADHILAAETAEDVLAGLYKPISGEYDSFVPLSPNYEDALTEVLAGLGLPLCLPSPDDE